MERYRVIRVVDGDSFDLRDRRRIRLLGLDAPDRGRCLFQEARSKMEKLVLGKRVKLTDVVTDDYGRILANVFTGSIFVNKVMLQEGLARFIYVSSPHYQELKETANKAKKERLGIYSSLCRRRKAKDKCRIKGNIKNGKKIYHLPSCKNYKQTIIDESFGDRWFCNEEEAIKAGFRKASGC